MIIVRPIRESDIDALLVLAEEAYPGMTTLPPDRKSLLDKIELSIKSIDSEVSTPGREAYLLVMEDTECKKLVGTAGLIARLGEEDQFYSYKLNKVTHSNKQLGKKITVETLHLTNHFEGFAEVATLFLTEAYRKNGNGKVLGKSRYLFMAQFRQRFPEQVMADLRGYFDEHGRSPFWEAIGAHFFDMSFSKADMYGALHGNQFIADLMPKHPIYVNLLPKEAQDVIGRPNDKGVAALAMLEKEGFRFNGQIDIFDGSPSVDTYIDELATIKTSKTGKVVGETTNSNLSSYLIATEDISSFSALVSELELLPNGDILLPAKTLNSIELTQSNTIRHAPL